MRNLINGYGVWEYIRGGLERSSCQMLSPAARWADHSWLLRPQALRSDASSPCLMMSVCYKFPSAHRRSHTPSSAYALLSKWDGAVRRMEALRPRYLGTHQFWRSGEQQRAAASNDELGPSISPIPLRSQHQICSIVYVRNGGGPSSPDDQRAAMCNDKFHLFVRKCNRI